MNETMDPSLDWDDLRLFLEVAREGGLAAAAVKTGKSAPTLGRRMLALERRLGLELFDRLPRGYVLTVQGQDLLTRVVTLEEGINPILDAAQTNVIPRVKISAGTWVTRMLCSRAAELTGELPVLLQFISADHVLDIGHREAVIGIRNQRPSQITLAGRPLGAVKFSIYAKDSSIETWVQVVGDTPSADWVRENARTGNIIEVTNPGNALDLAEAGVARAVLPTFIGDAASNLKKISDDITELEHMQWMVMHHEDRHLPEVRQIVDRVSSMLKQP